MMGGGIAGLWVNWTIFQSHTYDLFLNSEVISSSQSVKIVKMKTRLTKRKSNGFFFRLFQLYGKRELWSSLCQTNCNKRLMTLASLPWNLITLVTKRECGGCLERHHFVHSVALEKPWITLLKKKKKKKSGECCNIVCSSYCVLHIQYSTWIESFMERDERVPLPTAFSALSKVSRRPVSNCTSVVTGGLGVRAKCVNGSMWLER